MNGFGPRHDFPYEKPPIPTLAIFIMTKQSPTYFFILFLILSPLPSFSKEVPHEIAGIKLGDDISNYPDFEYSNFLKEVVVTDWHGFRKGIISYGICESPGTIVKMRMKYEDSSKKFFNTLMKKFKKKYGAPSEWKGDSFGIKHVWKWRFKDSEGRSVSMALQHNLQDPNNSIGNELKLSYPEKVEAERLCFNRKCDEITDPEQKKRKEQRMETGWDYLIPK